VVAPALLAACTTSSTDQVKPGTAVPTLASYFDTTGRTDVHSGGVRMIPMIPNHYEQHIRRKPAAQWPEPANRSFTLVNPDIYVPMQGPSELGASGKLANWDRTADLKSITVPTLVIGGTYDTMDPKHMEWMSTQFPRGRYLLCPNSGHMAMYDDGPTYYGGLLKFLRDVDAGALTK
jgi:proline iminopeptidase